ncbi:hypothetical protein J1N35_040634 [Gossypium stocksii]|uniref:Aspartic peptidase DDI1-type domain-containing protein n=1 Tax=Gossypium stocksii TaxID=47602 RepID=A0A9D3ZIG4_9ROSI|nr:hypothetical protein J1N35_040634 [Gossypium stocksii]
MIPNSVKAMKDRKQKGLMFVDINITNLMRSALVDTGPSKLFVSKKAMGKLGLLISRLTKRIKMVNSEEVLTMVVAQGVELQIDK